MFYPSGKPFTRWWWFACEIRRGDITAQLEWVKANGFGGVEIAWIYPPRGERPWRRLFPDITPEEEERRAKAAPWLSAEWTDDVAFAKAEATRLGLGCDFTFGTLWPFGDSQVPLADASRQFVVDALGTVVFPLQEIDQSWEMPAKGRVIDHLNRDAFARYADRMVAALQPALAGPPSAVFCESWEVRSETLWTDGLDQAFLDRYGYDIRPYLPVMWAPGSDPDTRHDYLELLSDRIIAHFYQPFADQARAAGAFSRAQVAGAPVDMLHAYALIDVPETEAMLFEPAFSRIVASAAVLGGRGEVSCEAFTCLYGFPRWVPDTHQFREEVGDLKLVADALLAHGVNQFVWHGMPFTPEGAERDFPFYASVHLGRNEGALSQVARDLNAYLERVCQFMKRGRTYSDVAVWLPLEDGRMELDYPPERQIPGASHPYELRYVKAPEELAGYHPLYVSNALVKDARVVNGALSVGDAVFRALYVDVKYLALEGLETLVRLAQEGLPVVLKQVPLQPGRAKSPRYAALIAQLRRLGVHGDFRQTVPWQPLARSADGTRLPDHWARVLAPNDILVFFAHPHAQDLAIPVDHGRAARCPPAMRTVVLSPDGVRQHTVRLPFAPNQSILVRVRPSGVEFVEIVYPRPE